MDKLQSARRILVELYMEGVRFNNRINKGGPKLGLAKWSWKTKNGKFKRKAFGMSVVAEGVLGYSDFGISFMIPTVSRLLLRSIVHVLGSVGFYIRFDSIFLRPIFLPFPLSSPINHALLPLSTIMLEDVVDPLRLCWHSCLFSPSDSLVPIYAMPSHVQSAPTCLDLSIASQLLPGSLWLLFFLPSFDIRSSSSIMGS